jgi:hypothetical protein
MNTGDQSLKNQTLAAYEPHEAPLEPSSSKGKLGSVVSKPKTLPDPEFVPNKIIHKEALDVGVIGMVERVAYGHFNARPACLIVFSFSLRSGRSALFFRRATFKLVFEEHQPPVGQSSPVVVAFAPRKIYGLPIQESKKITYGVQLGVTASFGPASIGPKGSRSDESSWERTHVFKTIGSTWQKKTSSNWDIVNWEMSENDKQHGIPDRLNAAVVVESVGPFQATAEVTVDTSIMNGLFGSPWSRTHPVSFIPGITKGVPPPTLEFEKLTQSDWKALVPYELEGNVRTNL